MTAILYILLLSLSVIAFVLALVIAVETAAAFAPSKKRDASEKTPGPVAVVIPAHNEAAAIGPTLDSISQQIREGDRMIVVADNCTDNTADIASAAGAHCWRRDDTMRRGKGYALQFALDRLKDAPPETVIFIDADCIISDGALSKLAQAAQSENRPAQALYLMQAPDASQPHLKIAEFAWLFLNHVRMRGINRLFGASRITGSGMALPWDLAAPLDVASGEIVEDMALTFELTERGAPPLLLENVVVTSEFPQGDEAIAKQRARWEHGSQRLAIRRALPSFVKGVASANPALCAVAADSMPPPILNFIAGLTVITAAGAILSLTGPMSPFLFSASALIILLTSLLAAWARFGRKAAPLSSLAGIIPFLLGKLRIYGAEGRKSSRLWTPTRNGADKDSES